MERIKSIKSNKYFSIFIRFDVLFFPNNLNDLQKYKYHIIKIEKNIV